MIMMLLLIDLLEMVHHMVGIEIILHLLFGCLLKAPVK
nr:MAG TPA: hypothetical protein [Caudoviricetes sp.]